MTSPQLPPIDEAELSRKRPKRKIGFAAMVVVGIGSCSAFLLVVAFFWLSAEQRRIDNAWMPYKDAGHRTTLAELEASYQISEQGNSAGMWIGAGEALDGHDIAMPFVGTGPVPPLPGQEWEGLDDARSYVKRVAPQLKMLRGAAAVGDCPRYDIAHADPMLGRTDLPPYLSTHRQACRVLSLAAYVHAHDGDLTGALASIDLGLKVALSLADEPSYVAQQLSLACSQTMLARLRELSDLPFSESELARLQTTIGNFDLRRSFVRAMEGESIRMVNYMRTPFENGLWPRNDDAVFYLKVHYPVFEASAGSWPDVLRAARTARVDGESTQFASSSHSFTAHCVPALEAFAKSHARGAAVIALNETALAARRYALTQGRLPADIEELVPEFLLQTAIDPFDEHQRALRIVAAPRITKIYSLGVNMTDEGGSDELQKDEPLDLVVELHSEL